MFEIIKLSTKFYVFIMLIITSHCIYANQYDFGDIYDDGTNSTPSTLATNDGARHLYIEAGTETGVVTNSNLSPAVNGITWTYENMPNNSNANGANLNDMLVINNLLLAQGASYSGGAGFDRLVLGHEQSYYVIVSQGTNAWRVTWPNGRYLNLNNVEEILFGNVRTQIASPIYLGSVKPDTEAGTYQSLQANLDDTNNGTNSTGSNDEDAYQNTTHSIPLTTFSLSIPCNDHDGSQDLGATVYAWVDFNGNQQFEADEYAQASCIDNNDNTNGSASLSWTGLSNVSNGDQFLRLRITSDNLPADDALTSWDERSLGAVDDGEIEDHILTIIDALEIEEDENPSSPLDYGDAPDTYKTLKASDGPSHASSTDIYLGTIATDMESDGVPNNDANGDNNADTNDEDGIAPYSLVAHNNFISHAIDVTNTSGAEVYLYAWLDLDRSGTFEVDELFNTGRESDGSYGVASNSSDDAVINLNWRFTDAVADGSLYMRVRISDQVLDVSTASGSDLDPRSYGSGGLGEVEDHKVELAFPTTTGTQCVFDLASPSFETQTSKARGSSIVVLDSDGPWYSWTEYGTIDHFDGTLPTWFDVYTPTDGSRFVGMVFNATSKEGLSIDLNQPLVAGETYKLTLDIAGGKNNGGKFNGNANLDVRVWGNPQQNVVSSDPLQPPTGHVQLAQETVTSRTALTTQEIIFTPAQNMNTLSLSAFTSQTIDNGANNYGIAFDNISLINNSSACNPDYDYGDAPDNEDLQNGYGASQYATLLANDGARHVIDNTICLGTANSADCSNHISSELNGTSDLLAATDTFDDGVVFNANDATASASGLNVIYTNHFQNGSDTLVNNQISVTASTNGHISFWLDLNQDGDWDDTVNGRSELITTEAVTAGVNTFNFLIPSSAVHGETYARIRYATDASEIASPVGVASDGEVEDYLVHIAAPPLSLGSCDAGLIINGDFDIPAGTPTEGLTNEYFKEENVPGWSIGPESTNSFTTYDWSSLGNLVQSRSGYGPGNASTPTGGNIAELNTFIPQMYYQDIMTTPGQELHWQFYWSPRRDLSGGNQQAELSIGEPTSLAQIQLTALKASTDVGFIHYIGVYTVPAGQYITRIALTPLQWASDGKGNLVDGVSVGCNIPYDFGDAPDGINGVPSYNTLIENNGPAQLVSSAVRLGQASTDTELNGQPTANADGDDLTGTDDDDVLDISLIENIVNIGEATSYTVRMSPIYNTGGNNAYLYAWVDWNNNGTFEVDEVIRRTGSNPATPGENHIGINTSNSQTADMLLEYPTGVTPGYYYMRVRLTENNPLDIGTATGTDEDPRSLGIVSENGEIEDHRIYIGKFDMGDMRDVDPGLSTDPNTLDYTTRLEHGGPAHIPSTDLFIGTNATDADAVDLSDFNDFNNDDPRFDDNTNDDEDAIGAITINEADNLVSFDIPVTNTTGSNAYLYAWFDYDRDSIVEVSELTPVGDPANDGAIVIPSNSGSQTVSITWSNLPTWTQTNKYYNIRLRLSETPLSLNGVSGNNEDPRQLGIMLNQGEVADFHVYVSSSGGTGGGSLDDDFDRDGVPDLIDIDDDNDGILDVDELGYDPNYLYRDFFEPANDNDPNQCPLVKHNADGKYHTPSHALGMSDSNWTGSPGVCANQNGMGSQSNKQVNNIWQGPGGAGGCDGRFYGYLTLCSESDTNGRCAGEGLNSTSFRGVFYRVLPQYLPNVTLQAGTTYRLRSKISSSYGGPRPGPNIKGRINGQLLSMVGGRPATQSGALWYEYDFTPASNVQLSEIAFYNDWPHSGGSNSGQGNDWSLCGVELLTEDFHNTQEGFHQDIDADDDGIPDNIEAQTTDDYILPNQDTFAQYINNNGLNSAYLTTSSTGGLGLTPVNTDASAASNSDTVPDYVDVDSDADGVADVAENGPSHPDSITSTTDTDGDGLLDIFDSINDSTVLGSTPGNWSPTDEVTADTVAHLKTIFGDADSDSVDGAITPLQVDLDYRDAEVTLPVFEHGDAPSSYGSASHTPNSVAVLLGTEIDYETADWGDGTDDNGDATDDDTLDDPVGGIDDEDGIASIPDLNVGTDTSYTLAVNVNNAHPTNAAILHVWLDHDGNGTFDVDEYQTATIPAATGVTTENITWNGLTGMSTGTRYVRARITTDNLTTTATGSAPDTRATGVAADGEVEDYSVTFIYTHPSIVNPSTTDTDNDGVMDDIDVDDDNDGILDVDESVFCVAGGTNYMGPTYFSHVDIANVGSTPYGAPKPQEWIDGIENSGNNGWQPFTWADQSIPISLTFNLVGPLSADGFSLANDYGADGDRLYNGDGIKEIDIFLYDINNNLIGTENVTPLRTRSDTTYQYPFSQLYENIAYFVFEAPWKGPGTGGAAPYYQVREVGLFTANDYCSPADTDNDFIPDHLDLDSDNDGIPDNVEAQSTANYVVPNNDTLGDYTTNNGLNTAYITANYTQDGITPNNNDGTDEPDWRDTDSDNTETDDTTEAGLTLSGVDANFDGMDDAILPPPSPTAIWQSGIVNSSTNTTLTSTVDLQSYYPSYNGVELDWRTSLTPDFGDAPAPYKSASHVSSITPEQTYLGVVLPDFDTGNWGDGTDTNSNASDDDSIDDPAGGVDDEDGVSLLPLLVGATAYSVDVTVTNTLGTDSYLYAWIDWDNNNRFDKDELLDAGVITIADATTQQVQSLVWSTLPTIAQNTPYYLRVRITSEVLSDTATGSDEDPRSFGEAIDGEVEDYQLLASMIDFGDAPDTTSAALTYDYQTTLANDGASHVKADTDGDNQVDITLGTAWDADTGVLENTTAMADDLDGTDDEDGVTLPTEAAPSDTIDIEITVTKDAQSTLNGLQLYAWMDWNADGVWDPVTELVVNQPIAAQGTLTFPTTIPTTVTLGNIYLRVRVCSTDTSCNTPTGAASDGEVEDYRIMISNFQVNDICDRFYVTQAPSDPNYSFSAVTPVQPLSFSFTTLNNSVVYSGLNSLAINRDNGRMYSTYRDGAGNLAIIMTDRTGVTWVPMGAPRAAGNYTVSRIDGGTSRSVTTGNPLNTAAGLLGLFPPVLPQPNMGTLSRDGTKYYVTHSTWSSYLIIDIPSMTFEVKSTPSALIDTGTGLLRTSADWAISEIDGNIYSVDLTGRGFAAGLTFTLLEPTQPKLYILDPVNNTVTAEDINFQGKAPNAWSGAVVTDDVNHLYAMTNFGHHDTNQDGAYDITSDRVAMYRINLITKQGNYIVASDKTQLGFQDASGCIASRDKGDAPESYGEVGHRNRDVSLQGTPDLIMGTVWDPDIYPFYTADATGDDVTGSDDEDGVTLPSDMLVGVSNDIDVVVTGGSGHINIFMDLDNDGTFMNNPGEHVVQDFPVTAGLNTIPAFLPTGISNGHDGTTFIRIRLCSAANQCIAPTGTVDNGEVEDYTVNVLQQMSISGIVFEDNGIGGATDAHDGIQDGTEQGLAGFKVQAIYNGPNIAGYNTGDIIDTQLTGSDGRYTFEIPVVLAGQPIIVRVGSKANWIDISEADVSGIPQVTSTSVTDNQMTVVLQAGDNLSGLNFGKVSEPYMEPDNFTEVEPGGLALFSHKFTVNTEGSVSFNIANKTTGPLGIAGWSAILFIDNNCNGELDSGDNQVVNPVATTVGLSVCLISKVQSPSNAPANSSYNYDIEADMTFVNSAVTRELTDTDTVRVTFAGSGELTIEKTVQNITEGTPPGTTNNAKPGDILEYVIIFNNFSNADISDVKLFDSTPEFTELNQAVLCSDATVPMGLGCSVSTADGTNQAGYEGNIEWDMSGTMSAGSSGQVIYRVKVN